MVDNSITINEYNLNHQKRILSKPILLPCAFHARPNSLVENLITLSVGQVTLLQLLLTETQTYFSLFSSFCKDDVEDGDSDVDSKDLDLPLRDPVHLATDKKFEDTYTSLKELGKYVDLVEIIQF